MFVFATKAASLAAKAAAAGVPVWVYIVSVVLLSPTIMGALYLGYKLYKVYEGKITALSNDIDRLKEINAERAERLSSLELRMEHETRISTLEGAHKQTNLWLQDEIQGIRRQAEQILLTVKEHTDEE